MQSLSVIAICLAFVSGNHLMAKYGIPTNDMYTFVKGLIDMNKPADHGAGPFFFDLKLIHPSLRDMLRKYLGVAPVNLSKP